MIFDKTDRGRRALPGLSSAWLAGGALYQSMGRLDACHGVARWDDALMWLRDYHASESIDEIQFWGHGKWGTANVDNACLDASALQPGHRWHGHLCAIRERMTPRAKWWFRTCETFGAERGHDFAQRCAARGKEVTPARAQYDQLPARYGPGRVLTDPG